MCYWQVLCKRLIRGLACPGVSISPTKPLVAFLGLFPCYITAALSSSGGRERNQVLRWGLWALDQVLLPSVSEVCQSLAALGQLMVGASPPCWLAPSCEQAAHSELEGEQLCRHVSLTSLTFCLS